MMHFVAMETRTFRFEAETWDLARQRARIGQEDTDPIALTMVCEETGEEESLS